MKAILEKIEPGFGSSFTMRTFSEPGYCNAPQWHFHPEFEIVYVSTGHGKRHIGDHISHFKDGDLIFLGPNLPHFGFTEETFEEHVEIVVQMKEDFLGTGFFAQPEMHPIRQMFERSRQGLNFGGKTKKEVGQRLLAMTEMDNFNKLLELLKVLHLMATSSDYNLLNAKGFALEVGAQDHDRMRTVYKYVESNFQEQISLDEMAEKVNMTVPAFCRYFKRLTSKTFTQFVNEFRIAHACRLLGDEHLSIGAVSFDSGFNNLSHFNKQFRLIAGTSPSSYRKNLKKLVDSANLAKQTNGEQKN